MPPTPSAKRIGRDTAIYVTGIAINRGAAFVMLPIYSRHLTPSDYGVIQLVEMTLDFIAILAGAKLALGVFRYYHAATTDAERNAVASTSLLLICGAYAVVSGGIWIAARPLSTLVFNTPVYASLLRLAAAGLASSSMLVVPLAYARVRGRSGVFVAANTAQLALQVGLNLFLLVHLELGARAVFLSTVIGTLAVGSVLVAYLVRQVGLHFSGSTARSLMRYGLPLVATQIATFVSTFGDRYFLNRHADMTTVGLYALAYQFGFLLAMVGSTPVDLVWEPIRFRMVEREDRDAVFSRAFICLNLLLISAALGITLFVSDVIRVMTVPAFYPAAHLVPIILVAYVLQSWTGMQDIGIHTRERTEYITICNWTAAGVAVIGYVVLIPPLLGLGAAIATVLAFATRYVMIFRISQRLLPIHYHWAPVFRLIGIAIVTALLGWVAPHPRILPSLLIRAALFSVYVAMVWMSVLSEVDRGIVRRFVGGFVTRRTAALALSR